MFTGPRIFKWPMHGVAVHAQVLKGVTAPTSKEPTRFCKLLCNLATRYSAMTYLFRSAAAVMNRLVHYGSHSELREKAEAD